MDTERVEPDEQENENEQVAEVQNETPEVEQPVYTEEEVRAMVRNYLATEEARKRELENKSFLDQLYETDKEEYARRKFEAEKEAERAQELRSNVATEYYTDLFKKLAPEWQPYLSTMTEEEKRFYNPLNPTWRSDADYLNALTAKVADMKAQAMYNERSSKQEEITDETARKVISGRKPVIDLPASSEGALVSPLSRNSRDTLVNALKETVGISKTVGGWDDDDSD